MVSYHYMMISQWALNIYYRVLNRLRFINKLLLKETWLQILINVRCITVWCIVYITIRTTRKVFLVGPCTYRLRVYVQYFPSHIGCWVALQK